MLGCLSEEVGFLRGGGEVLAVGDRGLGSRWWGFWKGFLYLKWRFSGFVWFGEGKREGNWGSLYHSR